MQYTEEIWKPVLQLPRYQVSNLGRIKGIDGRILKSSVKGRARVYLGLILVDKGIQYARYIHRLVAISHCPNPNNLPEVNHINCNRLDNRSENLEWVSRQQNMDHAVKHRLVPHGENQRSAKLTNDQVREMRDMKRKNPKLTYAKLGIIYGVDDSNAYRIVSGENYKYVL